MIKYLFYTLLVVLPLSTRQLITSVIPGIHEYEALFLYLSDVALCAFLLGIIFTSHKESHQIHEKSFRLLFAPLYIFLVAAFISTYIAPSYTLAMYGFMRLLLLVAFSVSIAIIMKEEGVFRKTLIILGIIAVIQAGIGIYQFTTQGDAGLGILGEPQLLSHTGSASTITVDGGRILRAYGTFPHPNIFGAFLLLGLVCLSCLYVGHDTWLYRWNARASLSRNFKRFISSPHFFIRLLVAAGMFIIFLALAMTLSRSAWIAAAASLIAFMVIAALRGYPRASLRLLALVLMSSGVVLYILYPIVAPRAQIAAGQPAVDYRVSYNGIGFNLISKNTYGTGLGNQVLYSVKSGVFQNAGMTKVWEWEPIHNLYLLIGAEIGVGGLLSFLVFLAIVIWHAFKHSASLSEVAVISLLIGFMVLALFDHYLWTIQPGRLMLWLTIGLALSHFRAEPKPQK